MSRFSLSFVQIASGVLTALMVVLGAGWLALRVIDQPGPTSGNVESLVISVERGWSGEKIAEALEKSGAISEAEDFRVASRILARGRSLKAGEYEIAPGASVRDIIEQIASGRVLQRGVTIPEGWSVAQVVDRLNKDELLTGTVTQLPPEGMLLPNTYAYVRGASRQSLIDRMARAGQKVIDDLWPKRAADLPFSTKEEALTLASIVEKETGVAEERQRVAGVYINRLRQGMRLEADPTIIYGITRGKPLGRGIRASEIRMEHPWNTYVITGLPPTPIANPGRDSIAAVLNPEQHDYVFFVADGRGGHVFARTLDEHNANVSAWREIERARAARAQAASTSAGEMVLQTTAMPGQTGTAQGAPGTQAAADPPNLRASER